ncbi:MAG: lipoprotein insertase outer membrane protein LolB [Succinivibrio sp.]
MKKLLSCFLFAFMLLELNGCATDSEVMSKMTPEVYSQKVKSIHELEENGKIALISRYKNSRFSVNTNYHYNDGSFSLEFTGAMGLQYAQIEVYKNGTTFLKIQGEVFKGDNARELLKEKFNIDVPVEELHAILTGIPKGELTYDSNGLVKTALKDDEYFIEYKKYRVTRGELPLPTNLEVTTPFTKLIISIYNVTRLN